MSQLLYCDRCWSPNDNLLGLDMTAMRCCVCEGGRARARRVWEAMRREAEWAKRKEEIKKEAVACFEPEDAP